MDPHRALALAPAGSYLLGELRVDVGDEVTVRTMAIRTPDSVVIPVDAKLPGGGFVRATIEVDPETYEKVLGAARRLGGLPVLEGMIERHTGQQVEFRRLLPRGG